MEDFHLLEKITLSSSAEKVKTKVQEMGIDLLYSHSVE